jgi:hypothetical protein
MGLRVKDPGASESRLVIGRIGVVTSSHPKGGRLPGGVGGRETSANRRRLGCRDVGGVVTAFAGAPAATAVLSVAGSAAVGSRLAPRPMGPTACLTRARCPMLELYAGKLARTVLRGRGGSNASLLPDVRHEVAAVAVLLSEDRQTTPAVLPAVSYWDVLGG